jgi:hypothetical protein
LDDSADECGDCSREETATKSLQTFHYSGYTSCNRDSLAVRILTTTFTSVIAEQLEGQSAELVTKYILAKIMEASVQIVIGEQE